jgi:hypothetical protein
MTSCASRTPVGSVVLSSSALNGDPNRRLGSDRVGALPPPSNRTG